MSGSSFIPLSQIKGPAAAPAQSGTSDGFIPLSSVTGQAAPSHLQRIGAELMQPVLGTEQLLDTIVPTITIQNGRPVSDAQVDADMIRRNQATIDAARGGDSKSVNWEQMGLDVVNPMNYAGGPALRAARMAPAVAAPVMGMMSALTDPVTGKDGYWRQKAEQAAIGAGAGKAADVVGRGLGRIIAPALSGSARILSDLGIRLTPGQMAGGGWKATEDKASSVPLVGDMIHNARTTSIHDFNRAAINQGLTVIGQSIPRSIEAGRDAINYMHQTVTAELDRVTSQMTGRVDQAFAGDMTNIVTLARNLPRELHERLVRVIQHDIAPAFYQGGMISGRAAQDIGSKLDNLAGTLRISADPDERRLGLAVGEVDAALNRMLERNNPALAAAKQRADAAYAHYKTIERAASMQGAKDGVFTPSHLLNSIRARDPSKDKASFARGNAMMQDLATHADRIIPSKVPDSGTAGRSAILAAPGIASFAMQRPVEGAALTAGYLAPAALYSRPGLAAVRRFANPGAGRQATRAALRALGPTTAPAAAQAALGLTQ